MSEKYIKIKGHKLFYTETNEGSSQSLFFIHGNSGSHKTWELQLNDPRFMKYRLIAFDLPGHGNSSHSINYSEDYSPLGTAKVLAGAIKSLSDNKEYILIGLSYGTNLIAEMLNEGLQPTGIVTIGMCCIGEQFELSKVFKENEKPSIFFYNQEDRNSIKKFVEEILFKLNKIDCITDDYVATDRNFRPALMQAAADGRISDEIATLNKNNTPICVIFGVDDKLVNANYLDSSEIPLFNGQIYKFDGGHFINIDADKKVNSLIMQYAIAMFTPIHVLPHNS